MQYRCRSMVLGLLLAVPALFAQTAVDPTATPDAAPATTPRHSTHKAQTPVALPQMPSGPLSQVPMEQIPATPAKVTFQGGLLEISAQNSTLGEILRNVRKLTGASIDIPQGSNAANERVVTHLGPGAPRDVLAVLLNGSSFNYVMVGSSSDPTAVSSVLLSVKPSATGESRTAAATPNVYPQPMPPNGAFPHPFNGQFPQPGGQPMNVQAQPTTAETEELKDDDQENAEETADDQAQPGQPDATDANTQVQPQQPDPNQPNAGPRTPEQILEMLRRQQQPGAAPVQPPQPPPQQ